MSDRCVRMLSSRAEPEIMAVGHLSASQRRPSDRNQTHFRPTRLAGCLQGRIRQATGELGGPERAQLDGAAERGMMQIVYGAR
jgi:hypothetical protein